MATPSWSPSFCDEVGGFLAAVTIGLIVGNVQMIVNGGNHVDQGMIGWFELFLAVLSAVILIALLVMNRRVDSPLIKAELLGWKIDVCSDRCCCTPRFCVLACWLIPPACIAVSLCGSDYRHRHCDD